jgi:uncharacterized protein YybS (DUF2232 family)
MRVVPQPAHGSVSKDIISGVAITCLLFAVAIYLPIIGFFFALFIPVPILFYRSKLGRTNGVIVPALSIIFMIVLIGGMSLFDVLFFGQLLLLGFVLSELFDMNISIEKTILLACCAVLGTSMIGLFFYSNIASKGIYSLVSEYVAKNLELTLAIYENMGMSDENIHMLANSLDKIRHVLVRIVPALVISSTLFVAWTSLLLARPLLRRAALFYPDFGVLNHWKAPEYLIWGVIGCGLTLFLPDQTLRMIALNGLLILMTIYFFSGIAIMAFFFDKKNFPRMLRIFLYSLIALQQIALLIVIGLGLFDMWFNFRKIGIEKSD